MFLLLELLNSLCTLTNYILILSLGCWTPAHFYKIWWMTYRTGTLIIYIPIIHSAQKNNNNINFQMFYMQCHRMRTVCTIPPPHERIMIDLLPINHHFWQAHFTFPALHYFLSKGSKVTFYNILLVRSYLSFQLIFSAFIIIMLPLVVVLHKKTCKRNYNAIKEKFGSFWMIFTVIILEEPTSCQTQCKQFTYVCSMFYLKLKILLTDLI